MPVAEQTREVRHVGNGVSTTFAVPFQFYEIAVYVDGVKQTPGSDYTIEQTEPAQNGNVVFTIPPAAGAKILILSDTDMGQTEVEVTDEADEFGQAVENVLDRLAMAIQDLNLLRGRSLRLADTAADIPPIDPSASPNSFVYIDEAGNFTLAPLTGTSSPLWSVIDQAIEAGEQAEEAVEAAEQAAQAANNLFALFNKRFLGAKSEAPSTDNEGNPLVVGTLYFDTTANAMQVWTGTQWTAAYVPSGSSVSSFNGRTGAVTPASGDYSAGMITGLAELLDAKLSITDLLMAILAVDGSGSGIDADLLDGFQASAFGRLAAVGAWTAAQSFVLQTLTDAATISWNLQTQQVAQVTLGDNRTLGDPSNKAAGGVYILIVRQDSTGGWTLGYNPVFKWPFGTPPDIPTDPNAVMILTFISDGVDMYGIYSPPYE